MTSLVIVHLTPFLLTMLQEHLVPGNNKTCTVNVFVKLTVRTKFSASTIPCVLLSSFDNCCCVFRGLPVSKRSWSQILLLLLLLLLCVLEVAVLVGVEERPWWLGLMVENGLLLLLLPLTPPLCVGGQAVVLPRLLLM